MIYEQKHFIDNDGRQIKVMTPYLPPDGKTVYTITVPFIGKNGWEPAEREIQNVSSVEEAYDKYDETVTMHSNEMRELINRMKLMIPPTESEQLITP